jgi:hypothetical protein
LITTPRPIEAPNARNSHRLQAEPGSHELNSAPSTVRQQISTRRERPRSKSLLL